MIAVTQSFTQAEYDPRHVAQRSLDSSLLLLNAHTFGSFVSSSVVEGGKSQVFYTLARGVDMYRRYLLVAAVLVCAAIIGGLIQRGIRRS